MIIKKSENIAPLNLLPGDKFVLNYEEVNWRGKVKKTQLLEETITEARIINRVAIAELEESELKQLGMKQGIAGIFGERA